MKLHMKIDWYSNAKLTLRGPGEVEVDDVVGEYLVNTFPNWFTKVEKGEKSVEDISKAETKETKLRKKAKRK